MKHPRPFSGPVGRGALLAALGAALLCAGCGSPSPQKPVFPARGKVLFGGKPITPALVVLHPVGGADAERPVGRTRQDGSYRLSTYSDTDGAPSGEYAVTVTWTPAVARRDGETEPGRNLLPPRYGKPETSGLRVRIAEGPNDLPTFDLKQ